MSAIQIASALVYDEDRIAMLWNTLRLARGIKDEPLVWKLTDPFLDSIALFLGRTLSEQGEHRLELCTTRFLDVAVEYTTGIPRLLAQENHYYVEMRCV